MSQLISEHARLIDAVLAREQHALSMVNGDVARSWQRCLQVHELDPQQRREPLVLAAHDLADRQDRCAPLLTIAKSEMANLYQQVAGSGYAILLTDIDGVILNYVGDPQFTETANRNGLHNGAVWSEAAQGTNGMGTCIIEQKPLVIHQNEHFLACHTGLTCSAAPIRDPDGNMLAVLDASAESRLAQQHTMVLVKMSAQMIENRMFLSAYKHRFLIRFHSRPEFVSTLGEGVLAVDEQGLVLAANHSALFQLGATRDGLIGRSIAGVFNQSMGELINIASRPGYHPAPIHSAADGRRFFSVVQLPAEARTLAGTPRPVNVPAPANLHDLQRLDLGDPTMARNVRRAHKLLDRGIPLLLAGETGTGKSLFARAFHDASARSAKPFVAINCASIPETLIESELFGYKAGAFTGANRRGSRGKIVQADGGTLFLDEIGDMPLHLQARLLRVLEEKEVVPLGSESPQRVDIAVISATHQDLLQLVRAGRFREDLYYRLHGVAITLPPLRERRDKRALIRLLARLDGPADIEIAPEAMKMLLRHPWPGNIRQLRNTLRAVLALSETGTVTVDDLPDELQEHGFARAAPDDAAEAEGADAGAERSALTPLQEAERKALIEQLERAYWNVSKAAATLDISRNTLYRRMKSYGIRPPR